ncbi:DUF3348 family protein [Pusillimonas sp.]|uniref:DUF3348 family protein n=1 Tax=Pusillimonas sp. TaxID=3040095 RepID=UPI0037CB2825
MVTELPRRTSFSGPALVRLLSRLARVEVTEPRQPPAARLDEWLGWAESIQLSKVLNAAAPSSAVQRGAGAGAGGSDGNADIIDVIELARAEYTRVRATLEQAIAAAVAPPAAVPALQRRQFRGAPKVMGDVDFPSYRRRYSLLQQKMESGIAALRGHLRGLLAARSLESARLAAMDAAMEQALAEHELRLLMGVPRLLESHFERLRHDSQAAAREESGAQARDDPSLPDARAGAWLDTFRHDMGQVMRAELDLRLQPVEGMLSAISIEQNTL